VSLVHQFHGVVASTLVAVCWSNMLPKGVFCTNAAARAFSSVVIRRVAVTDVAPDSLDVAGKSGPARESAVTPASSMATRMSTALFSKSDFLYFMIFLNFGTCVDQLQWSYSKYGTAVAEAVRSAVLEVAITARKSATVVQHLCVASREQVSIMRQLA